MQANQSLSQTTNTTDRAALLEQKRTELRHSHRELDEMLARALDNATDKRNRKHLELSRMHNSALLNYKMSLLTACWHLRLDIDQIKIDYDSTSQLFSVKFSPDPSVASMIAIALNNRQAPQLASSARAYIDISRAIESFDTDKKTSDQPSTTQASDKSSNAA